MNMSASFRAKRTYKLVSFYKDNKRTYLLAQYLKLIDMCLHQFWKLCLSASF